MLPAYIEIMLAADDLAAAREGADELRAVAATLDAPFLRAVSAHAHGATLFAEGEARAALVVLREASAAWDDIEAPYEAARTRRLIGDVFKQLGDQDSANIELRRRDRRSSGLALRQTLRAWKRRPAGPRLSAD